MNALSYAFAFVSMLGVLIFIHELGHFLAAKLCGVRVLKFSLGFGPTVGIGRFRLAWTRHGTEYVVGWFPLGGFVKMLGENPGEEDDPEARVNPSETLGAKPVWQKLAIVFAGPVMNLLLPVVVFTGTLAVGLSRPAPVIGSVEPSSPAAEVGLAAGDRVVAVAAEPVVWWNDVEERLRAKPGERVKLAVERGGERREVELQVEARSGLDDFGTVRQIGWSGLGHSRLRAMLGIPDSASPAARAGLRSGDRVVELAGEPVEDWVGLAARYAAAGQGGNVTVVVERGGEPLAEGMPAEAAGAPAQERVAAERIQITAPALGSLERLGVVPANVLVSRISPDSPAEHAGLQPGDLLLEVDGSLVGSFASFAEIVRASAGRPLAIEYARGGQTRQVSITPQLSEADTGLGIPESRYLIGITAEAATLIGAVGIDRERNPFVSVPRAIAMTAEVTHTFLRGLGKLVTGEVSRKQLAGPIGIAEIAHSALERGWEAFLSTMVLISINLGILNLLPIPVLDGGQAVLFAVEGIKRSPVSLRTREIVQQIGLTVLVLLMGVAFWNDVSRHWSKLVEWLRSSAGL